MHYDDGMDPAPGEDLKVGDEVVGPASYDMDGDGVADSFIMASGANDVDVLTDADGDGQVDSIYHVRDDGSVAEMRPEDGRLVQVGTGHLDAQGRIVMDGTGVDLPDPNGSADAGGPGGDGGLGSDAGSGTGGPLGSDTGAGTDGPLGTGVAHDAGAVVLTAGDQTLDVGTPTIDLTGDGVTDTVKVPGSDGSTLLVADTDQDGQADNIVQVNPDGSVVFAIPDGRGGWLVSGTGQVDDEGTLSRDPGGAIGGPYDPPLAAGQPAGDLTVDIDGTVYRVGEPTLDVDGSGAPDTAVLRTDDGGTILVTDVDGNGTGDQIVQVRPDGSAAIQRPDGQGGWTTVATGHLNPDGELVLDRH